MNDLTQPNPNEFVESKVASGTVEAINDYVKSLQAELAEAYLANDAMTAKVKSLSLHETCACSYDAPDHICNHHSPKLAALEAELAGLKARQVCLEPGTASAIVDAMFDEAEKLGLAQHSSQHALVFFVTTITELRAKLALVTESHSRCHRVQIQIEEENTKYTEEIEKLAAELAEAKREIADCKTRAEWDRSMGVFIASCNAKTLSTLAEIARMPEECKTGWAETWDHIRGHEPEVNTIIVRCARCLKLDAALAAQGRRKAKGK